MWDTRKDRSLALRCFASCTHPHARQRRGNRHEHIVLRDASMRRMYLRGHQQPYVWKRHLSLCATLTSITKAASTTNVRLHGACKQ